MKPLPCPKCGNTKTLGTFCADCLRELHPLVKSIKDATYVMCESCPRVKHRGTWKKRKNAVEDTLLHALVAGNETAITGVTCEPPEFEQKPGIKKKTIVKTTVHGTHEHAAYEETYDIPLAYEVTLCPHCKKRGTTYFEGVLQMRNENQESRKAVAGYIEKHKGVHITKTAELGNGTDYFLTDHRAVGQLAQHLHKRFGGELKVNAQHFSLDKQASKTLYRTNALVSLPEYGKGDVILLDEHYLKILGMGAKITAEDLLSGQKRTITYKIGEAQTLPQMETQVTSTTPLEVLHPVTFQAVTPQNQKDVALDAQVTVAVDGENVLLL